MGLLDNLLNAFLKATDPRPRYTEARCLLYKNSVGGCDRCHQACPKGAVRLESFRVELDEVLCTGCGLCTGVCPGVALEEGYGEEPKPKPVSEASSKAPAVSEPQEERKA